MYTNATCNPTRTPWNKGKLVGQKRPLRLQEIRSGHLSRRQYSRIVRRWVSEIGLDPALYGTHSMRRSTASIIYRKTKNVRAVKLLLGHSSLESTVRPSEHIRSDNGSEFTAIAVRRWLQRLEVRTLYIEPGSP